MPKEKDKKNIEHRVIGRNGKKKPGQKGGFQDQNIKKVKHTRFVIKSLYLESQNFNQSHKNSTTY